MKQRPPRVLVADSDVTTRAALRRQFEGAGYPVCTVSSGEDAILMCDIDPPEVLILDVHLPDMDGFDVCERVRHGAHNLNMTVIIITEPSDDMTRAYLGQMVDYAGGDFFLAKPCDGHLLVQLVADVT